MESVLEKEIDEVLWVFRRGRAVASRLGKVTSTGHGSFLLHTAPAHKEEGSAFHKPRVSQDLLFHLSLVSYPVVGTVGNEGLQLPGLLWLWVAPGEEWGLQPITGP